MMVGTTAGAAVGVGTGRGPSARRATEQLEITRAQATAQTQLVLGRMTLTSSPLSRIARNWFARR
jgi:hypothetical protein